MPLDQSWVALLQGVWLSRPPCSAHAQPVTPAVFIYSMPGYKCSIKERMLYSSCKSRLLDSVEQDFQLEISKKVGAHSPESHCPRAGTTTLHWDTGVPRQWSGFRGLVPCSMGRNGAS